MGNSQKTKRRQKSKRTSKGENDLTSRRSLAKIVDQAKAQRKAHTTDHETPNGEKSSNDPKLNQRVANVGVPDQFKAVFARFQPKERSDELRQEESNQQRKVFVGNEEIEGQDAADERQISQDKELEIVDLSKKRFRKLNKPSLAELKSTVVYPEVIQWYDCDSPSPKVLAKIKSSKNVVPVPTHWQLKREYLSGRSVTAKKPFELPEIIRQTNVEEMRNTLPTQEPVEEKSLKENSRARIRPKLGSLDLDYRKLHDAFFKLGRNWKPEYMLSYGDEFYENRNLEEEVQWKHMERSFRPGRISKELRIALGLPEGKLPPWCSKFNEHGMPPSYPDYKVAGVNWDISNIHGDVYGVLETKRDGQRTTSLFGEIVELESEDEDTNENAEPQEQHSEVTKGHNKEDEDEETAKKRKKMEDQIRAESMKEVLKRRKINQGGEVGHERPKRLYSVIGQKDEAGDNQLTGSRVVYDISGSRHVPDEGQSTEEGIKRHNSSAKEQVSGGEEVGEEDSKDFKF